MKKDIFTMGFEIPGFSNLEKDLSSNLSLMDADIVAISPEITRPNGYGWVNGYFGSDCATDFGGFVPGISVRTVPMITVRSVPVDFGQEPERFDLCHFGRSSNYLIALT